MSNNEAANRVACRQAVEDRDYGRVKDLLHTFRGGPPARLLSELLSSGADDENLEIVGLALDSGANDNPGYEMAAIEGNMDVIEFLERRRLDTYNMTLSLAIEYGHLEVALWSVNAGASDIAGALIMVAGHNVTALGRFLDGYTGRQELLAAAIDRAIAVIQVDAPGSPEVNYLQERLRMMRPTN